MLCLRALAVIAVDQFVRPCSSGKRESVVPWPKSTGMSSLRPFATCHFGPFLPKNALRFSVPGTEPSGQVPVAAPSTSAL